MNIEINRIKKTIDDFHKFNQVPLEDIVFYDNGKVVKIPESTMKDFAHTGLNNSSFIEIYWHDFEGWV